MVLCLTADHFFSVIKESTLLKTSIHGLNILQQPNTSSAKLAAVRKRAATGLSS